MIGRLVALGPHPLVPICKVEELGSRAHQKSESNLHMRDFDVRQRRTLTLKCGIIILGNMIFLDFVGPSLVCSRQNDERQKELLNKTKVKNTKSLKSLKMLMFPSSPLPNNNNIYRL